MSSNKQSKRVIVTGGLGVIGQYLAKVLRSKGYEVLMNDLKIVKLDGYRRGDVTEFQEMLKIFEDFKPDVVYHLAGEVGRENGEEFPKRCIDINVSGTMNLIQLCMKFGTKLIFSSTSEVYGKLAGNHKLSEDLLDKFAPEMTNCYAISKYQAEQYMQHFSSKYGLQSASVRFFMCYGEGEYPNPYRSAMCNFIYNLQRDKTINVHKGTSRSWCYISDITDGLIAVMENNDFAKYESFNIGRDDKQKMEDVAKLIAKLTKKPESLISYTDYNFLVTPHKDASFEKAKKLLGFEAKVTLEEGIKKTIAWQNENVHS